MSLDMSQFLQVFFEETEEHLAALEQQLLTIDVDNPDPEALNAIFRAAHSIKGSSGMFGFDDLTSVTHILETLLDKLRSQEVSLEAEMIDVFLQARDVLWQLMDGHRSGEPAAPKLGAEMSQRLQALTDKALGLQADTDDDDEQGFGFFVDAPGVPDIDAPMVLPDMPEEAEDQAKGEVYGFFADAPGTPETADTATASSEEDQGYGFFVDLPDPKQEKKADDEAFGFFDDAPGAPSAEVPAAPEAAAEPLAAPAEAAPVLAPVPAPTAAPQAAAAEKAPEKPAPAAEPAAKAAPKAAAPRADSESSSIRVSVEKIDTLVNLVGELVITQSMLNQLTQVLDPSQFERIFHALGQLEHNTRDLQEQVMSIRMLPISFVFSRFPRLVRDTSSKLNKKVELILQGEHTELDKGVIEKLADPLTHIVRNSVDHGIEKPEDRLAAGKPEQGTIRLSAFHQGGSIVVTIADDGKGLSREKLLAKAKEKGLPAHEGMSDNEVWQLIFMPGFSTAEQVTDLSGRGVGMDVVKRNIQSIGGKVEIDSALGVGTRITIRLPLTLAILDGMILSAAGTNYVVPLTYIVESLQPVVDDIRSVNNEGQVIRVRGEYMPLFSLHQLLGMGVEPPKPETAIVVILEAEGRKFALLVDYLVGQQQVVIKSLEQNFHRIDGVAGATIMGDGSVALILDVDALPQLAGQHEFAYEP
ncbi:two-component system, chemotaxis family, sensor kinase CheA [Atopomonas hussainii]|uniref:Chemotaxis protein CheA n=1 Tax=Atopomonas hussainii TaxID=1429083 RepID=A0A1H7SYA0_9GAMM|nr:chemotaxis protein CheA [Atopomonas hussainii]SEL77026.1 two-component system, chemotaxis family, sensor kinase CheA [Atopomonas hussainii]